MSEAATTELPLLATAIHVGASSVSMVIAERGENGSYRPLDFLEQPAPLARDIFRHGRVTGETTERIVDILSGFREAAREMGAIDPEASRAVATNILVEAANHDVFLNRIRIACGLTIYPIDDGEMTRLIYLKTRRRLDDTPVMRKGATLVIHVGPGNTRALLFNNGAIDRYTSYRLGNHRTREAIEGSHAGGPAMLRVIREHASGNLAQLAFDYHQDKITAVVFIGYEIQQVRPRLGPARKACAPEDLRTLARNSADMSDLELVEHFQIDYQTADALVPSLETNLAIAEALNVDAIHIPDSDYEQGLLTDLLVSRSLVGAFKEEVLRASRILADRYRSDPRHGAHVAALSARFFEELQDLHGMDEHDKTLLHVTSILHEVGTFISPRAHHKHSEYIILNSEIFGLDRHDVKLVALISRYHRHSGPRPSHEGYRELTTHERIRVSKLAAILRVADALERTHDQRVQDISIQRGEQRLHLTLPGLSDAAVERLAMESKGDLFRQVFGLEVVIDDA